MLKTLFAAAIAMLGFAAGAAAQTADSWTVRPEWVRAHESFLASDALQGRGSATRDEAIAAAYVASQFEGFGLKPAPGMTGYIQTAKVIQLRLEGPAVLTAGGKPVAGATMLYGPGRSVGGSPVLLSSGKPGSVVIADTPDFAYRDYMRSPASQPVKLLIVKDSSDFQAILTRFGGKPRLPAYLDGDTPPDDISVVILPAASFDALVRKPARLSLTLPGLRKDVRTTTNAIGYLPGTDAKAGVLLFSAHLDHLGVRADGVIMHGANDDASGTTAVLELAHAFSGKAPRRGVLFVAYGSEEIGEYGSRYFGAHPPVPLGSIIANIEVEMVGVQDPKMPAGTMMMTGFDRSNLGPALKAHGALVAADPYPDEHFFERSDNYQLALKGVVAHTISGWGLTPTLHQPTDTIENLDILFMTRAIQSLIAPAWWLANGDFTPAWNPGGQPHE